MAPPLLTLSDIRLTFGGDPLLTGAEISVSARERIALVGRNGCGKSTFLKIAAGIVEFDDGERFVDPGAAAGYLPQEPDLSGYATVDDYVRAGLPETTDPSAPDQLLDALKLSPGAATDALSGGEARRAALVRLLAARPDVLLLDEPTNHLDLPAITWLEDTLQSLPAALVVISHDRRFLEAVTTRTVWLDRGQTRSLNRGFAHFEGWRDQLLEEEERDRHKRDRKIAAEEDWVRYGVTARRKRNVRRLQELHDLRKERREDNGAQGSVSFSVGHAERSGKRAILAEGISKSFGDRSIIDDFSIEVTRGDRIGIVAPNGAGKTTLLKMLIGELTPDAGAVTLGANLQLIALDQRRAALQDDMRVADAITDGRGDWVSFGEQKKHVSAYLKDFLFTPEQWRAPVSALSGGERGRLALASALAKPSNLLVLDEPTNDLDLETLDLLEEMLADYPGTLLLVSHDRRFLDRLVTSVIAPAPAGAAPGKWLEYVGGYDDMVSQRGGAPGIETPQKRANVKPKSADAPAPAKPKSGAAGKLSYKEKYALEQLPLEMAALEEKISAARAKLADPAFFEQDSAVFAKTAAALEAAEERLAAAEEEWLELEMKREALES